MDRRLPILNNPLLALFSDTSFLLAPERELHAVPLQDKDENGLNRTFGMQSLVLDPATTEVQVLLFINLLVLFTRPTNVLETGTCTGVGTLALASAMQPGMHLTTIDVRGSCRYAANRLVRNYTHNTVAVNAITGHTLDYLASVDKPFDFAFFDSVQELKAKEAKLLLDRGMLKGIAVFHDTSPYRFEGKDGHSETYLAELSELAKRAKWSKSFDHSRGFTVMEF